MLTIVKKFRSLLGSMTLSQLMAEIGVALIVFIGLHCLEPHHQTIATVDITNIVNQFVQSQAKRHLPAKILQERVKQFGQQLQGTLDTIAEQQHVVLLVQEAALSGALDLTPQIKQALATKFPDE